MTNHLPECRYVIFQQQGDIPATVMPMGCICSALRACEQRIRNEGYFVGYGAAMDDGWGAPGHIKEAVIAVLDAAWNAVEAIPAPYKIRGDFETYGSYYEGKADFKDLALSAIDVLRKGG